MFSVTKIRSFSKALKRKIKNIIFEFFFDSIDFKLMKKFKFANRMCEIVGKRFIKFWAHADFVYRWTDLYKVQQKHCDNINILTSRVSELKWLKVEFQPLKHKNFDIANFEMHEIFDFLKLFKFFFENSSENSLKNG